MRYRSAALLMLFSVSAAAQTIADQFRSAEGPLSVYLRNTEAVSPRVIAALQAEVEALLTPAAIRVNWQSQSTDVVSRIAVVRLTGRCETDAPIPGGVRFAKSDAEALGQTQVVDGKVLPIADIRCDAVRLFIADQLKSAPAADRDELLGRAVARVMAHELYHILLRTRSHGRDGLARPAQTSAELVAARTVFSHEDDRRLAEAAAPEPDTSSSDR